jgi:predicted AlkP superfamily phosphohydrolase/phosphomutase
MGRVLAIGLDSADEEDVRARMDAGTMPHLSALRDRGTWCSLEIDALCRSEHPWSTFVTGVEPEHLGRWTTVSFDPATYRYGSVGAVDVDPFWSLGDDVPVVAFDVPASRLTRSARGRHVVDWASHEPMYPRSSSPPGLLAELDERFGANPAVPLEYAGTWNDAAWLRSYGSALVTSTQLRTEVAEHLLSSTPDWRLGLVVYGEPHQVAHHAWQGVAPGSVLHEVPSAPVGRTVLDELHRELDDAVGRLAGALAPEDVVVVFSPKNNEAICDLASNVLAPELLHRLTFGEPRLQQPSVARWERRGRPPVVLPGGMSHVRAMQAAFGDHRLRRARLAIRQAAFRAAMAIAPDVTDRLRLRRRRHRPEPWVEPDPATLASPITDLPYDHWCVAAWYRPWWSRMPYFVLPSFSDLHVRINVVGREGEGTVAAADYVRACDEVEGILRACRNPRTGHALVADVSRPRGSDPFAEVGLGADLVVSWAEDTDVLEHPEAGVVGPYPAWRAGGHGTRGFALLAGGDVGRGTIAGSRIVDLPATLIELTGAAAKRPIDGTPFPLPRRSPAEA